MLKYSISKTSKNISILHKFISIGDYEGSVNSKSFELKRKHFGNNFKIIGILKKNKIFTISANFTKSFEYVVKFFEIFGVITSVGLFILQSNWIIGTIYFLIRLILHAYFIIGVENEIRIFSKNFRLLESQLH